MRKFFLGLLAILLILALGSAYLSWRRSSRPAVKPTLEATVRIIEGWTAEDIVRQLAKQDVAKDSEFAAAVKSFSAADYPWVVKPANSGLEGFLFPDTYRFIQPSSAETVLKKMLDNFSRKLDSLGVKRAGSYSIAGYPKQKLSLYQVLTLASIIEKESGGKGPMPADEERQLVAGVFYNRLSSGQALQANSTLDYVTKHNDPFISDADRQLDSPYNTYKYPGLPPTPIANPGLASIKAAFFPQKTDYNYFFHIQPSGQAVFSKTFDEHLRKQRELQK